MNTPSRRPRLFAVAVLFSTSIVCLIYAAPVHLTQDQEIALKQCQNDWHNCWSRCHPYSYSSGPAVDECINGCGEAFKQCLRDHGIPPALVKNGPGSPVQQVSPPPKSNPNKPRRGPGQIAAPTESHPTPTPRRGPGKVSSGSKNNPTSTASPSAATLQGKAGKSTPTPTPTPSNKGQG